MQSALRRNRDRVLEEIERACAAAGRRPEEVRLLAVTKAVSPATALQLFGLGQVDLGENRVDVFERKLEHFREQGASATWHFIGHVQRNKAARVVRGVDVIHSVDSLPLLESLERHAAEAGRRPEIFLQLKLTEEETKYGLTREELDRALDRARELEHLRLVGLMTMAPLIAQEAARREAARAAFERLATIARELPPDRFASKRPLLSMGMSGDFVEAIAAGAHVVRIGTALFRDLDEAGHLRGAPPGAGE